MAKQQDTHSVYAEKVKVRSRIARRTGLPSNATYPEIWWADHKLAPVGYITKELLEIIAQKTKFNDLVNRKRSN